MIDLNSRKRLYGLLAIAGILVLVAVLGSLHTTTVRAQEANPGTGAPTITGPNGACVLYDSWCGYCAINMAAACQAFVPPHAVGTTAAGAENNARNELVAGVDAGCGCSAVGPVAVAAYTAGMLPGFGTAGFSVPVSIPAGPSAPGYVPPVMYPFLPLMSAPGAGVASG